MIITLIRFAMLFLLFCAYIYRKRKSAQGSGLLLAVLFLLPPMAQVRAQGNLLLTPRRIVFEGKKRTRELNMANTGKDTARYLISMIEIRMNKNGKFETITEPDSGQMFASKYVRFFPHSVVLAPNAAQTIKVQVTNPDGMATGEYRSHIYIRAVPNDGALGSATVNRDSSEISVHLVPQFGLSLPIIIRIGESNTQVSISDISTENINDSTAALNMVFNRTGNMSVYGDLRVKYIGDGGSEKEVVSIDGISVYAPTPSRIVRVELKKGPEVNFHKGKFYITYTTPSEQKSIKMADAEYILN